MKLILLKAQSILLNTMLLILGVLNMMMYYDLSIADMGWGKVGHIFAENTIKVSNYAFIDTNDNQEYDNGEQTIAVSINFNDMVILPNDRNIFKIGPLGDGSYSYSINVPAGLISSFTQPMTFHITNTNVIGLRPIPLKGDGSNSRITQRKTYLTNGFDDVNQDGIQQSNESSIRYTIFSADGKMIRNSDDVYPQKFRLGVLPNGTYYYQMYKNNIIQKTYFALVNGSINYDVDGNHGSPISKTEYYKELSTKKIMDMKYKNSAPYKKENIAHTLPSPIFQSNHTILSHLIERNQKLASVSDPIIYRKTSEDILQNLGSYQISTTKQTAYLYEIIFSNIMNYLLQQGIIDNMQYKELLSTINFVYRSDCKKFEGNVTFRYTKDKSILQNMDIYIPSCGRPALVAKMGEVGFELIAHEIGHYIYHHDPYKDLFTSICRNNGILKEECSKKGFTRSYGKLNPSEDYAESFMLRLKTKNNMSIVGDAIIDQKIAHFPS